MPSIHAGASHRDLPRGQVVPEFPDVEIYVEKSNELLRGKALRRVELLSPFLLRSVEVPVAEFEGRQLTGVERMGKRLIFAFADDYFLVLHLMIAGRLRWKKKEAKAPGKSGLAIFRFDHGALVLTEASTHKRASLFAVKGRAAVDEFQRDGVEVLQCSLEDFRESLTRERHTIRQQYSHRTRCSDSQSQQHERQLWGGLDGRQPRRREFHRHHLCARRQLFRRFHHRNLSWPSQS